jgi:DNA-binding LacI/PurR family transcriptional regulator
MSEKAIIKLMNTVQTPLVVINREVSQAPDRCVFFEQQDAAFKAVDYLINQGHRRSPVSPSRSTRPRVKRG